MPIKVNSSFEPNGNFALTEAKHIEVSKPGNIKSDLQTILSEMLAAPELNFEEASRSKVTEDYFLPLTMKLNSSYTIPIEITGASSGCQISVVSCPFETFNKETGGGTYSPVLSSSGFNGVNYLAFKNAITAPQDLIYKVTISDNRGNTGFYQAADGTILEYLLFRVTFGDLTIQSNFDAKNINTVYSSENTEVEYEYTTNYGVRGYRWLFYKRTISGETISSPLTNLNDWNCIPLNDGEEIAGGVVYETTQKLTIFEDTVSSTDRLGQHTLTVLVGWSDNPDAVSGSLDNKFQGKVSAPNSHNIVVLAPNSASITYLSDLRKSFYSNEYLTLDLLPKTNIGVALESSNSLKATCSLYKVLGSGDLEELPAFTREYTCTPAVPFTYSARQTLAAAINESTNFVFGTKCYASYADEATIADAITYYSEQFTVQISERSSIKSDDLLFNFIAEDAKVKKDTDLGCFIWEAEDDTNNSIKYRFAFKNFTEGLMGIQTTNIADQQTSSTAPTFCLQDLGIGVLSRKMPNTSNWVAYSPWQALSGANADGFTLEAYFLGDSSGLPYSDVLSMTGSTTDQDSTHLSSLGIQIGSNLAHISNSGTSVKLPLLSNTWQHVAAVVDLTGDVTSTVTNTDGTTTTNPQALLQIYINGALCKVTTVDKATFTENVSKYESSPLCLNGKGAIINHLQAPNIVDYLQTLVPTNQGMCKLKFIRGYSVPLTADEIYENYKNSMHKDLYDKLESKETTALPKIYFCPISIQDSMNILKNIVSRNEWQENAYNSLILRQSSWNPDGKSIETTTDSKELEGIKQNLSIADLNLVNEKYPTASMKQAAKNTLTSCIVYCDWQGKGNAEDYEIFEDVEVSLQGTSTLKYPVKNYKIKTYNTKQVTKDYGNTGYKRSKKAFVPKLMESQQGWETGSAVYTLKCDYMEQSHRNNTPTACFYEDQLLPGILDYAVSQTIGSSKPIERRRKQSPAIRYQNAQNKQIFRDAIAGFPCEVYYTEELRELSAENCSKDSPRLPVSTEAGMTLLGTYMFNVDKEGDQFGFEIETNDLNSGPNTYSYSGITTSYFNTELAAAISENIDILPCSSIEGSENADMDMGASGFQPYEGLYTSFIQGIFEGCQSDKQVLWRINNNEATKVYKSAKELWLDLFTEDDPQATGINKLEYCYCTDEDLDAGETLSFSEVMTPSSYFNSLGKSKQEYYAETLEPRFSYMDEDDSAYFEKTFNPLIDAISWVYRSAENASEFTKNFSKYFSFEYCLAHYLQLMMFTQVDNASKNTMYDSWGGVIYPRPYDMDTQMGFSNTGEDSKQIDSEMHVSLSPLSINLNKINQTDGKIRDQYAVENWEIEASENADRYKDTYAAQSALWRSFGKYFNSEIAKAYKYLRKNGIYTVNNICDFVDSLTYDKISAKSYNKDAELKYFSVLTTWAKAVSGDRRNRYRQYLTERMIYLDSLYDYTETDSLNTSIMLRSNTTASEDSPFELVIQVHSPQYMRLSAGSGAASYVFYASPDDTYNNGRSKGTLIRFPLKSGNKEITLSGAGNIKALPNIKDLDLTVADLGKASRLTELDLSGSSYLSSLTLGSTMLNTLDLSDIGTNVQAFDNNAEVNLASCSFLKSLKLNNAKISTLTLPENTILETLDLRNSSIQSLKLIGAKNLVYTSNPVEGSEVHGLSITNSRAFTSIELNNCPNLSWSDFSSFTNLTKLSIQGCPLIKDVNLHLLKKLEKLELDSSIETLNLSNAEWIMERLDLSNLSKLRILNINSAKAKGSNSIILLANQSQGVTLDLDAGSAQVATIVPIGIYNTAEQNGNLQTLAGVYDFDDIKIASLQISNNTKVQHLINLTYSGNLQNFFKQCTGLVDINSCSFTSTSNYMSDTFYKCTSLTEFIDTNWNVSSVTEAPYLFSYCTSLKYSSIKGLLSALENVTNLSNMLSFALSRPWPSFEEKEDLTELTEDQLLDRVFCYIPKDFFSANTKVTNLAACFRNATTLCAVEPNVFELLTSLVSIENIFLSAKNLCYVANNIMVQSPISSVNYAFANCTKLGTSSLTADVATDSAKAAMPAKLVAFINTKLNDLRSDTLPIGQTTSSIFNTNKLSNITSVRGLFYNCSKLTIVKDWLATFFAGLTALTDASLCFYNCKLLNDSLESIIKDNIALTEMQGSFAGTGLTDLPETSMFDNTIESTFSSLQLLGGIFAGCTQLKGILTSSFFVKTPGITSLGLVKSILAPDGTRICLPGAFANTKLSGCTDDCLTKLTSLQDCSTLFYQGICDTTSGALTPQDTISKDRDAFNIYKISSGSAGSEYIAEVTFPTGFFNANLGLKTAAYCFDYAFVEYKTSLDSIMSDIFEKNTNLQDISGLFLGCTALKSINVPLVSSGNSEEDDELNNENQQKCLAKFFKCVPALKYAQALFADTKLKVDLVPDTFSYNTLLENARAMFMNTEITGGIPAELFNNCRSRINDISYMFAGCDKLSGAISTGYALINDPVDVATRNTDAFQQIKQLYDSVYNSLNSSEVYTTIVDLVSEYKSSQYTTDIFKPDIDRQLYNRLQEIPKISKLYNSDSNLVDELAKFEIELDIDNDTCYSQLYESLADDQKSAVDSFELPYIAQITNFSLDLGVVYTIHQKGLLSDCANLANIRYLFAGCRHLVGPIPADMFYYSSGSNGLITSIEGLFENCCGLTMDTPKKGALDNYGTSSVLAYKENGNIIRTTHFGGGNFDEIYPDIAVVQTVGEDGKVITDFNLLNGYKANAKYLIPKDWLISLPNIRNISKAFYHIGTTDTVSGGTRYLKYTHASHSLSVNPADSEFDGCIYSALEIPNNCFSAQKNIENASYAFAQTLALGRTNLGTTFLSSSLNSLTDISYIFAGSYIYNINKPFERASGLESPLQKATWAFCGLNRHPLASDILATIQGFTPATTLTGNLPAMWDTQIRYTKLTSTENVFGYRYFVEGLVPPAQLDNVPVKYWTLEQGNAADLKYAFGNLFSTTGVFFAGYDSSGTWTTKKQANIGTNRNYTLPNYN